MATANPGDQINTTVRLSQAGDITFEVQRNGVPVPALVNQPATFIYTDVYTVKVTDNILTYTYSFTFADDNGDYTIEQSVNGKVVNADGKQGADGHGPFLDFFTFERG